MKKTAVINYGLGNLRSVVNAIEALGHEAFIAERPEMLRDADRIVLPGVGAFGDGMTKLVEGGWTEALEREVREIGKPFIGLCLGMQLLATSGTEHGVRPGLGWVNGTVDRLPENGVRIPHVGWNDVRLVRTDGLYADLRETGVFYFVHSYVLQPEDSSIVTGVCDYGAEFCASIETGNVFATQYHPEKSQKAGLSVLGRFLTWKG